jgi:hypothetical protein
MTEGDELREWLKWITGGIIGFLILFWQWMERKIERMGDRLDKLREDTRSDRHDLADKIHGEMTKIDGEIDSHSTRLTKLEKNGH